MTDTLEVVGGVDTHADTIHVAAITILGHQIADREFPATAAGYARAVQFLASLGTVVRVGVEGTASYGAGFARAATAAGFEVAEVSRSEKSKRRRKGKSDALDAYAAARTALVGHGLSVPKNDDTMVVRALHVARRSAVKHRTAAINQFKALLVAAPNEVREKYRGSTTPVLIRRLARCRPTTATDPTSVAVLTACKNLAERILFLEAQDKDLTEKLDCLVASINPALCAAFGVGTDTAAQLIITAGTNAHRLATEAAFAALCGVAPVPASSGKTTRYRLSRGGDRAANCALHTIALVRMRHDQRTKDYIARQLAAGKSPKDVMRKLKRAIAREVFTLLTGVVEIPDYSDLRPVRQAKNITVTAAAQQFGVWPDVISRLERGLKRDDAFVQTYREWLDAA